MKTDLQTVVQDICACRQDRWEPPLMKPLTTWIYRKLAPDQKVVCCAPHADDSEFCAATIAWMTEMGIAVHALLFWSGYRCPGLSDLPWTDERKARLRRNEFEGACICTGAKPEILNLDGYEFQDDGYRCPQDNDTIVDAFSRLKPRLVIVPPLYDCPSHFRVRELAAIGLVGAGLKDCQVLSFNSPWNPLGGNTPATLYFPYHEDDNFGAIKELALSEHASQNRQLDYCGIARHESAAYALKLWELTEGHHKRVPREHRWRQLSGCETFRLEQPTCSGLADDLSMIDPLQRAFQALRVEDRRPAGDSGDAVDESRSSKPR